MVMLQRAQNASIWFNNLYIKYSNDPSTSTADIQEMWYCLVENHTIMQNSFNL
jgi:hypothetical protein